VTLAPTILYQSAALVAVNKPSGLAVHRGQSRDPVHALELVRDAVGAYVYPLHRLDRATSGVLVFALSQAAAKELGAAFALGSIEKQYLALVRGNPPDHVVVDHPLSQDDGKPPQAARTEITTRARYGRYALVEATPKTGRTHQIRVHLAHMGHPILGDATYGTGFRTKAARLGPQPRAALDALGRQALHAYLLAIEHPETKIALEFRSELPGDLRRLREALHIESREAGPEPRR